MFNNFGGLPKKFSQYKTSKIAILPIEFDKSISWLQGAAKGPKAIIDASKQVELYDIETDTEVYTQGIFTAKSIKAESSKKMGSFKKSVGRSTGFLCYKDEKSFANRIIF